MHDFYLRRAIQLAHENVQTSAGGPFGAVIVHRGKIISEGANHVTTWKDPTAHAEIVAIREACRELDRFDLKGCTLYASCEPCPMCLGAIYWSRCDALFFAAERQDAANAGFDDSFIYQQIPLPATARAIPTRPMLREEGLEPFQLWKATSKRVPY